MNKESKTVADCEAQDHEECQNRRQFFNGLGKWSLAIIAAVSSRGMSEHLLQAAHEEELKPEPEIQRPAWTVPDDANPAPRLAGHFRSRHGNETEYLKARHANHTRHYNSGAIQ